MRRPSCGERAPRIAKSSNDARIQGSTSNLSKSAYQSQHGNISNDFIAKTNVQSCFTSLLSSCLLIPSRIADCSQTVVAGFLVVEVPPAARKEKETQKQHICFSLLPLGVNLTA